GVRGDCKEGLDGELASLLDAQRGLNALFVEESLLLASVEVLTQVDQRTDSLLPALLEADERHSRRDLVGKQGEGTALPNRVNAPAGDPDHPDHLAARLERQPVVRIPC